MKNSLFCSFNSLIYDVLVVFDVWEKIPYFIIFFLSSILESFEEHRGSMLMIKIDNRLPKLGVDIPFFFHFKEWKSREFTESTAIKLISVLLSKKSKRVSLKTSCNKSLSRGDHICQRHSPVPPASS